MWRKGPEDPLIVVIEPLDLWIVKKLRKDDGRVEMTQSQRLEPEPSPEIILTGIDAANLSRIEQGKYSTGVDILSRICVILDAHLDLIPNSQKEA